LRDDSRWFGHLPRRYQEGKAGDESKLI